MFTLIYRFLDGPGLPLVLPSYDVEVVDFYGVLYCLWMTLLQGRMFKVFLFTSVPIDPALNIIKDLLEKDEKLNDRTVLSVQNIIELLGFCLHNTYFSFQNRCYEQVEHVPMGSLVSPIVTNQYMECFERKALRSAITPTGHGIGLWMTHRSSKSRHTNKHSWTTSIAWIQKSSLQWKGLKKMEPFHSLIPLSHP